MYLHEKLQFVVAIVSNVCHFFGVELHFRYFMNLILDLGKMKDRIILRRFSGM